MQGIPFSLIYQLFYLPVLGPVLYLAMFHPNVIICFTRHKAYFIM